MKKNSHKLILGLILLMCGCSGQDDPRTIVKGLVSAVLADDSTAIEAMVDWDTMVSNRLEDMSPEDSASSMIYYKNQFFESLVDSGYRRLQYLNAQIVLGKGKIDGLSAEVELSFIDRDTRVQNYTKVLLSRSSGVWKIVYFY